MIDLVAVGYSLRGEGAGAVAPPEWWDELNGTQQVVYVTMGSSGSVSRLSDVLDALSELPGLVAAS